MQEQEREHVVTKIAHIMGEMGVIGKDKKEGSKLNYGYQGIDEAVNALNPLMAKHGVIATIKLKEKTITEKVIKGVDYNGKPFERIETTADVTCIVTFTDGYTKVKTEEGSLMSDFGRKAVTQAISMCYKYALIRTFLIRTKGETDPDEHVLEYKLMGVTKTAQQPTEKELKLAFIAELKKANLDAEFVKLNKIAQAEMFGRWNLSDSKDAAMIQIISELKQIKGDVQN